MSQFPRSFTRSIALRGLFIFLSGLLLAAQVGVLPAAATGVYDLPSTVNDSLWVVDEADTLSRLTEVNLSQTLKSLATKTGNQVRLVTLHRLDYGETVESFADKLFTQWFPTAEDQAEQTLLVLDNVTNTAAIRSGATSQSQLSEDVATSVAQETLLAPIRAGNKYNQAFTDATSRLVAVLSGEPDPGPPVVEEIVQTEGTFATAEETKESNAMVWVIGLLAAATIIPMATYYFYQFMQSR
ncbi:MAG: YgcG family protein [Leptolyngbyaceae cyanobacterium SL_7_1]|nr:YgcG family protein [Leptolyngbyaceae cyanobacterium SL_7_1]